MRQVTRKGLMTMAAATGVLAAAGGAAHADSGVSGHAAGSPGVGSGNTVQVPVHVPVNVCGNTVDVVGVLDPSVGNSCAGQGAFSPGGHGGSHADGHTAGSPGVGSGNHIQVPIHVPVNVCGNDVDILGAGNAAEGGDCANGGSGHDSPGKPGDPGRPGDEPGAPDRLSADSRQGVHSLTRPRHDAQLAQTGSELPMGLFLPVGAGALLAGAVLYRKARAAA
ncbi:chaplin [Streptomyces pimonensis]|uniref:Chaplin n=1 Tax=Streptomyces pimonensis TaxID=2860288 RepID=A0ABV4IWD2_9ACTN